MRGRRNLALGLGLPAVGIAAVVLVLLVRFDGGLLPAGAQLPELQVTITPDGCGEVAVAAVGSADSAFVYTSESPSAWAHAADTHLELRARAKAGCTYSRWTIHWGGVTVGNTTANPTRVQMLDGMTATAHFSGTPATPTPTPTPSPVALSVTAGEGGSVAVGPEPSADGTHPSGTTVTITATADKGYDFAAWQGAPGRRLGHGRPGRRDDHGRRRDEHGELHTDRGGHGHRVLPRRVDPLQPPHHRRGHRRRLPTALLSDPDDLTSTMEWTDLGYTNPPYALLVHVSDATGVSRTSYYRRDRCRRPRRRGGGGTAACVA